MKTVTVFTDGACSGNPGPGGWAAILQYGGAEKVLSGGAADTTNNRMELLGVISALEALKEPCRVELYSDSKYVIDALQKRWVWGWKQRGWIKSDKKPALNRDLWERLLPLVEKHEMVYHWIKGHAETEENNRCDQLAVAESRKYQK
ncbi:MAG TPA: ribonuclease HI [Candidatus Avoscillospira avicola]|uniref:Ribonuclease H n=1 Tax=Candidatus Avoscillospira avicola TaxID=2840706 RepID=A0A9D1DFP2_9FIRM|nr:ribonuclease HI [Candidatus Avoscillospira avicola]